MFEYRESNRLRLENKIKQVFASGDGIELPPFPSKSQILLPDSIDSTEALVLFSILVLLSRQSRDPNPDPAHSGAATCLEVILGSP